jgi:hypothetical protein
LKSDEIWIANSLLKGKMNFQQMVTRNLNYL